MRLVSQVLEESEMNDYDFYSLEHDQYRHKNHPSYGIIRKTLCLLGAIIFALMAVAMFSVGWNDSVADGHRIVAHLLGIVMIPAIFATVRRLWW